MLILSVHASTSPNHLDHLQKARFIEQKIHAPSTAYSDNRILKIEYACLRVSIYRNPSSHKHLANVLYVPYTLSSARHDIAYLPCVRRALYLPTDTYRPPHVPTLSNFAAYPKCHAHNKIPPPTNLQFMEPVQALTSYINTGVNPNLTNPSGEFPSILIAVLVPATSQLTGLHVLKNLASYPMLARFESSAQWKAT